MGKRKLGKRALELLLSAALVEGGADGSYVFAQDAEDSQTEQNFSQKLENT